MKIGIIGTGAMGAQHAVNIVNNTKDELYAIADPCVENIDKIKKELAINLVSYSDGIELINDTNIDAIIVASPDKTHSAYVLKAIEKRKPVLCEKPLASSLDDAIAIVKKEKESGLNLVSVGFMRRFDPQHQQLKKQIESNSFGKALLWKGLHRNASALYNTEGSFILNNSAGHDIDSASWILNSKVKTIEVKGIKSHDSLDENSKDLLLISMEMENGTLACAEVYVNAGYGYEVNVETVCQDGIVSFSPRQLIHSKKANKGYMDYSDDFRAYFEESYNIELKAWLSSIHTGKAFEGATAYDGYLALLTTIKGGESLNCGSRVSIDSLLLEDF